MEPKVTLVSHTNFPVETIYYLWEASRTITEMQSPHTIYKRCQVDPEFKAKVRETFEKVIDSAIPVAENITFVFLLENISISFREQMVRHRIGVKVGDRLGVDMFPDIHDSTWWSQSMRVLDMSKFADNKEYRMPELSEQQSTLYKRTMYQIQETYKMLVKAGVPIEDAREVLPLATTSRISWGINLAALIHILQKRGCWILQLGLWGPIIQGMVQELSVKIDPYFRTLVQPPCIKGDAYVGCTVILDNEKRVKRDDPLPPCALYLHKEGGVKTLDDLEAAVGDERRKLYESMSLKYTDLWGRDVNTGHRK